MCAGADMGGGGEEMIWHHLQNKEDSSRHDLNTKIMGTVQVDSGSSRPDLTSNQG